MKRKHFLQRMFSGSLPVLLLVGGLLAACDKEDMTHTEGTPLPEGKYPLELTAGGLQVVAGQGRASAPGTRGTTDNDWEGVTTVAVQVDGEVKPYTVTPSADKITATLTAADPFYWQTSGETKSIVAWYPYSTDYPENWKVQANQSTKRNYETSDLIFGNLVLAFADKDNSVKNKMVFTHQTAKVKIDLTAGAGVTLDGTVSVQLLNVSGVENGQTTIRPYRPDEAVYSYLALLNGQDIRANEQFIKVSVGGTDFYYTPTSGMTLEAGLVYTYTITVKANGIEVTAATSGQWDSNGEEQVTSDIIYTAADLKPGDYFYRTTGNEWAVSDGGLRKIYADGTTEWESDKTPDNSKGTCIGIVLKVGRDTEGSWADNCDYTLKGSTTSMSEVHGYVLALRDANGGNSCQWGSYEKVDCDRNQDTGFNGYSSTQTIVAFNEDKNWNLSDAFPAAYYATTGYEARYPAPANTSGWFLPSGGQCQYWLNHKDIILRSIQNAGGDRWKDGYWSSSEYSRSPTYRAYFLHVSHGDMGNDYKVNSSAVRACLAF